MKQILRPWWVTKNFVKPLAPPDCFACRELEQPDSLLTGKGERLYERIRPPTQNANTNGLSDFIAKLVPLSN